MTTIAYRDGIMAADSLSTANGIRFAEVVKMRRVRGVVFGFSGSTCDIQAFADWIKNEGDYPSDLAPFEALVIDGTNGLRLYECGKHSFPIDEEFTAIGTGREIALAAMHMGATSHDAVKLAIKLDTRSGGPIRTLKCPEAP